MFRRATPEFSDLFRETRNNATYLQDLDNALKFEAELLKYEYLSVPPMSELYTTGLLALPPVDRDTDPPIISLANKACAFYDNTEDANWAFLGSISRKMSRRLWDEKPDALGAISTNSVKLHLEFRSLVYDVISTLMYNIPLKVLWQEVQNGNADSLLKLARIDKSIVTDDGGAAIIRERQVAADWDFFKALGRELGKPPVSARAEKPLAVILTARFWRAEFCDWSHKDLVAFLVDQDLLGHTATGHKSFLRQIVDLGLTKGRRGRPKKRD